MFSRQVEAALQDALQEAVDRRHEFLTVEHLLFALLADRDGADVVVKCGGNLDSLRMKLERFFEQDLESGGRRRNRAPLQTTSFRRLLERCRARVISSGKEEVAPGDILAAMLEEPESNAAYFLKTEGVTRLAVLNYISHGISSFGSEDESAIPADTDGSMPAPAGDPLEAFTENLTERAAQGKIDPLIGRDREIRRTLQVLCRRRKHNPIYVGEPGVGKTALVEGLALRIREGTVPEPLRDASIYRIDLGGMLAGTRFRGDFEQRLKAVLTAVVEKKNAVLFIDEIHTVVGAGSTSGSSMDASNILKPVLTSGELKCIGATTYAEYKAHFEKDGAFSRRFQKIEVSEPTVEETVKILEGLKSRYEEHHGARYTQEAVEAAAELAAKHINDRFLPDKAIDVLDEAGANVRLLPDPSQKTEIDVADVEAVVSEIAKIPARSVSSSDKESLATLEVDLKARVFGQDEAISSVVRAVKRSRAGLTRAEKPVGSFLFTGPTGVGKTEVARQLAAVMGIHFARYDMSEYMESHAVARLIGAPPGYVGYDRGGLLTDEVRKHPHAVVLLDEIEKAHPDLFNILLQVMDHAVLTDNNGRKADFRNAILLMTSNAGARDIAANELGFHEGRSDDKSKGKKAVEKAFSPEFRNRLDAVVVFGGLSREIMEAIVDKFVRELENRLSEKKVRLALAPEARAHLAERGHDRTYGARPLARLIQTEIEDKLCDEILFGRLQEGGRVRVDLAGEELALEFEDAD